MQYMLAIVIMLSLSSTLNAASQWVNIDGSEKLIYAHTKKGDRIADYSFAGYKGGGIALPEIPGRFTVQPSGKDDTVSIQHAIDQLGELPLINGSRGAVVLGPGIYHLDGTLRLARAGMVLRGAGMDAQGTTLLLTGSPHMAVLIAGELKQRTIGNAGTVIDPYIASGTSSFQVTDSSNLNAGDTILITKPVTQQWLQSLGMDNLGDRHGISEHWIHGNLSVRRRIAAVSGNRIELEVPLMDSYDSTLLGENSVLVSKVVVSGQLSEVGIEQLRVVAPVQHIQLRAPKFDGLKMQNVTDSWIKSVSFEDTTNSVSIDAGTERISVVQVDVINHTSILGDAKPFDFSVNGSQILLDRCSGTGDRTFYFATQAGQQGPVVLLHCRFMGNGHIQPHQRWSTGLLVDECEVPGGGIDFMNRGQMGSGHGWSIAWAVAWNNVAKSFAMNQPPGAINWVIGNIGALNNPPMPVFDASTPSSLPEATVESGGKPVEPRSLYLQQLKERLGVLALKAIGYP